MYILKKMSKTSNRENLSLLVLFAFLFVPYNHAQELDDAAPTIISPSFANLFRLAIANQSESELMGLIGQNNIDDIQTQNDIISLVQGTSSSLEEEEVESLFPLNDNNHIELKPGKFVILKTTLKNGPPNSQEEEEEDQKSTDQNEKNEMTMDAMMEEGDKETTVTKEEEDKGMSTTNEEDDKVTIEAEDDKTTEENKEDENEENEMNGVTTLEEYQIQLKDGDGIELALNVIVLSNDKLKLGCHFKGNKELFKNGNPIIYASTSPCSSLTTETSIQAVKLVELTKTEEDDEDIYNKVELEEQLTNGCVFALIGKEVKNEEMQNTDDSMKTEDMSNTEDSMKEDESGVPFRRGRMIFYHRTLQRLSAITINLNDFNILGFGSKPVVAAAQPAVVSSIPFVPAAPVFIPAPVVSTPFDPFATFPNIQIPGLTGSQIFGVAVIIILFYILYFATSLFSGGIFNNLIQNRYYSKGGRNSELVNRFTDVLYKALSKYTNYNNNNNKSGDYFRYYQNRQHSSWQY